MAVPVICTAAGATEAERIVQACVRELRGIDCTVNNAGIVRHRTMLKMTVDEFDYVIAVHLRGTFLCGRTAADFALLKKSRSLANLHAACRNDASKP